MTKTGITLLSVGLIFGILLFMLVGNAISFSNTEIQLRQQVAAQQDNNRIIFDKVWKVISQQAQVTDKYKDSFRDVFLGITNARYDNAKNVVFNWIQENNPTFDVRLFDKLMVTIEAQRNEFALEQKKLIDINRQHTVYVSTFPNSIFASIFGRSPIDIKLVTSAKTEQAFETRREDSVGVF
jgi:hypothetical protein